MAEGKKRGNKAMSVVVWVLMAMLILGLGGFGVTNFGTTGQSIATVGDEDVDADEYARALQQQLQGISQQTGQAFTLAQAQQFGLDAQVRQQLVSQAALSAEANRIGLSVGDRAVADAVRENQAFSGVAGGFDRDTYDMVLRQNGLTPSGYETILRDGIARSLLVGAVSGGFAAPQAVTDVLYDYVAERRVVSLLHLTEADLPEPVATPDDAALRAFYDAHTDQFMAPETRQITYAALLPEAVAPTLPVDEAALRELYENHSAEFNQPERRLVERLVFPDDASAQAAKDRIDAGETFDAIVAERGLDLADTDLGDVAREELGAAADAVFALTDPGVVGPIDSNLGPALFRMNGILAAQETPFEDVRDDLATEYQADAARRAVTDRRDALDDLLAGGATIEDLADQPDVTLGTIDYSAESTDPIAGYPAFRDAAEALREDDFPELVELDDGGFVALRLDGITPAAPRPFEEARADVEAAWHADALRQALSARATEIATDGAALSDFGTVTTTDPLPRDGTLPGAPADLMATAFGMEEGERRAIDTEGWTGVLHVDTVQAPGTGTDAANALKAQLAAQMEGSIAGDARTMFTQNAADRAGVRFNQSVIDAVHAQIP